MTSNGMDELMISGKRYISAKRAGKEYHYHSDYIGQLIRADKIAGQKVGRSWYVSEASLTAHLRNEAAEIKEGRKSTKQVRTFAAAEAHEQKKSDAFSPAVYETGEKADAEMLRVNEIPDVALPPEPVKQKLLTYIPAEFEAKSEDMPVFHKLPTTPPESAPAKSTPKIEVEDEDEDEVAAQENEWGEDETEVPIHVAPAYAIPYNLETQHYYREAIMPLIPAQSGRQEISRLRVPLTLIGIGSLLVGFVLSYLLPITF